METVKSGLSAIKTAATESMEKFPFWAFAVVVLISLACLLVHIMFKGHLVNAQNIRNKTSAGYSDAAKTVFANQGRKSLTDYLNAIPEKDPKTLLLTNFYFSTVNATGLFFPAKTGVYSPNAVKFAVQGGARAFVLDIWPSLEPFAGFKPILHSVEKGSKWRRVSMNSMDVATAIDAIVSEVYTGTIGNTDYTKDVVLLYFRFHGGPRNATYDDLAKTCARSLAPYKLDPSFSSCRGNATLFQTPITALTGKVIILSNKTKKEMEDEYREDALEEGSSTTNPLIPYINICPQDDSIPVEVDINAVDTLPTKRGHVQSSIVFVAPPDYSKEAETNNWGAKLNTCINNGVHCMALNQFAPGDSGGFADILFQSYFKTYSYRLKDKELRIDVREQNPATSAGDTNVGIPVSTPGLTTGNLAPPPR